MWQEQQATGNLGVGDFLRVSEYNQATDRDEVEAVVVVRIFRHPEHGVKLLVEDEDGVRFYVRLDQVIHKV